MKNKTLNFIVFALLFIAVGCDKKDALGQCSTCPRNNNSGTVVQVSNWTVGQIYFKDGLASNRAYPLAYYNNGTPVAAFYNGTNNLDVNWLWSWGYYTDGVNEFRVMVMYNDNNKNLIGQYLYGQYTNQYGQPSGWPATFSPNGVLGYAGATINWMNNIPYITGNNIQGITVRIDSQIRKIN